MDYNEVSGLLLRLGTQADAAEVHGSLCGRLCLRGESSLGDWLEETLSGIDALEPNRTETARALSTLHLQVWSSLDRGDMAFTLLLPMESASLAERTVALAAWAQGFLHGLACSGVPDPEALGKEHEAPHVAELMSDFVEISRASFEAGDDEDLEEAEQAWVELVEFMRVGVQMAFEELAGLRPALQPAGPAAGHS